MFTLIKFNSLSFCFLTAKTAQKQESHGKYIIYVFLYTFSCPLFFKYQLKQ